MSIGVDLLPKLLKHTTDRNRTSPFAFTGNRFEFRAVGSSQSVAGALVALNTIMSESCDFIATELEKLVGNDPSKLPGAIQKVVGQVWKEHKAIVFNGDGYSEAWHAEAEKRGLPNAKNTVAALPALITKANIDMFEKYGVLTAREVHSRYDTYLERYCKDVNTESLCALSMAKTMILPAAFRYERELAEIAASLKAVGKDPHLDTLDILTGLVSKFEAEIKKLEKAIDHQATGDLLAHAKHFCNEVLPAMKTVRDVADELETIVADDLWPLPTYREMLFIK